MTTFLTKTGSPPRASLDRVQMIRCSLQCFWYGLIGIIPVLGLGKALQAMRLWREVMRETREPVELEKTRQYSLTALVLAVALVLYDDLGIWGSNRHHLSGGELSLTYGHARLVIIMGLVLAVGRAWWLFRQYRRAQPQEWNPARNLAYWGAGLGYAGLVVSLAIIILVIGCLPRWFRV